MNRISARQGKYRRSREGHGVPRKEGTGARFVPGGGKVLRFHGKSIHISPPKKTNVRLSDQKLFKIFSKVLCDIFPARFRRFYRKIALLFSSKNDKNLARKPVSNVLRKNFKQLLSMTEDTVLCFMLPVQELFMKIAGAVANCRFYAKDCKSIPRVVQS